jgi:hypothetical protein
MVNHLTRSDIKIHLVFSRNRNGANSSKLTIVTNALIWTFSPLSKSHSQTAGGFAKARAMLSNK